jgi:hypothetical protein
MVKLEDATQGCLDSRKLPLLCQDLALLMPECQLPLFNVRAYCPRNRTKLMEMVKKAVGRNIIYAVKIGLAGVVSILVARLLRLPQGYCWQGHRGIAQPVDRDGHRCSIGSSLSRTARV